MKKLFLLLAVFIVFILISTSCTENTEQPNSPSANTDLTSLAKSTEATASTGAQYGKLGLIGKIFSNKEAKLLFGDVVASKTITAEELNSALSRGSDYIMFTLKDNQVVIRNEKKQYLSNERVSLQKDEPMYFFSKSKIKELLETKKSASLAKNAANNVSVELRGEVLTLSYGEATLELSLHCPPVCWE